MWTRRKYTFQVRFDDPLMLSEVQTMVKRTVDFWNTRKGFEGASVTGTAFGMMQVTVTIQARDQWDVHRRAMRFARAFSAAGRIKVTQHWEPVPEKLVHPLTGRKRIKPDDLHENLAASGDGNTLPRAKPWHSVDIQ